MADKFNKNDCKVYLFNNGARISFTKIYTKLQEFNFSKFRLNPITDPKSGKIFDYTFLPLTDNQADSLYDYWNAMVLSDKENTFITKPTKYECGDKTIIIISLGTKYSDNGVQDLVIIR